MIEPFLKDLNIPKLSDDQKITCEGKITSEECALLLDSFQNNKTPGNDGIPIEFYRKFWPLISESFIQCANDCFSKTSSHYAYRKERKRPLLSGKLRPISLINVDAKIMSKAIATRIKNVLPNIIPHNQTGFIKDRYIGETVRSIFDKMGFTAEENIPGLLIFIDFQKAFVTLYK